MVSDRELVDARMDFMYHFSGMSDKGAQTIEADLDNSDDGPRSFESVTTMIERMIEHAPTDPIEKFYWYEFWLRSAARKFSAKQTAPRRALLRRMAVLYAQVEGDLRKDLAAP